MLQFVRGALPGVRAVQFVVRGHNKKTNTPKKKAEIKGKASNPGVVSLLLRGTIIVNRTKYCYKK